MDHQAFEATLAELRLISAEMKKTISRSIGTLAKIAENLPNH